MAVPALLRLEVAVCTMVVFSALPCVPSPAMSARLYQSSPPRYRLAFTPAEYAFACEAVQHGVERYGGNASVSVTAGKNGTECAWDVEISEPRLIEVWAYWVAELTTTYLSRMTLEQIDAQERRSLETARAVHAKLDAAIRSPFWESKTLSGRIVNTPTGLRLIAGVDTVEVLGEHRGSIGALEGRNVVARGSVRAIGTLTLENIVPIDKQTLEICIMGLCPYGKSALKRALTHVASVDRAQAPAIIPRFIFYRNPAGDSTAFSSLHGEAEVVENLVQMTIRDEFPTFLHKYLLARADSDQPWANVLAGIGCSQATIREIEGRALSNRQARMEAEYARVAGVYGILDGSPSYVWEGLAVSQLSDVALFSDAPEDGGRCDERRAR